MLNSLWGKFGQRSNLTQTTYTDDPALFMDMMTSDKQDAYKLVHPNNKGQISICKVRGITLNFKKPLDINYDTVLKMGTCGTKINSVTLVDENKIVRNPEKCCIVTK
ncbi:hypothetical protein MAR_016318, partial [Mya arenaria]